MDDARLVDLRGDRRVLAALEVRDRSGAANHIFNPSNIGLVLCFLILGSSRAEPLDFWWGPMSAWLVLALVVIFAGGFTILSRLSLLRVALSFWVAFAAGIGVLALAGHQMTARWHLGPISGFTSGPAGHLTGGARLPLLHDHRPEDSATRTAGDESSTRSRSGYSRRR